MAEEKMALLEALGEKRIRGYAFEKKAGYKCPVCEIPLIIARRILAADEKGRKHQAQKIAEWNRRLPALNAERALSKKNDQKPLEKRKLADEPNHINFRVAKKLTGKAKEAADAAVQQAGIAERATQDAADAKAEADAEEAKIPDEELPDEDQSEG